MQQCRSTRGRGDRGGAEQCGEPRACGGLWLERILILFAARLWKKHPASRKVKASVDGSSLKVSKRGVEILLECVRR